MTRPVSPSLARCELTHLVREPIDVARAATALVQEANDRGGEDNITVVLISIQ